jgi:hypothetical protein
MSVAKTPTKIIKSPVRDDIKEKISDKKIKDKGWFKLTSHF